MARKRKREAGGPNPATDRGCGNAASDSGSRRPPPRLLLLLEHHAAVATLALLTFLAALVFRDFLFGDKLYLFSDIGSDTVNLFYPRLVHVADYLRSDGLPSWSFSQGMGQDIFPFSLGDPFNWILYACGSERLALAIAHVEALKIIAAGMLFFAYLRAVACSHFAASAGAVLFAFSSFMVVGGSWYLFSSQGVQFALYLLAIESQLGRRRWWLFPVAIALIAALQPPNLFPFTLIGLIYGSVRFVETNGWNIRGAGRFFGELAALGALGLCMSAFFSLSILHDILNSPRGGGEWSPFRMFLDQPVFAFGGPLQNLSAATRILSSDVLGNGSAFTGWYNYLESPLFYCGVATLVVFGQSFRLPDRRKRKLYAALILIAAFPLVFPFFRYGFWLFSGNYYRLFSLLVVLALLYPAARALDHLSRGGKPHLGVALFTLLAWLSGILVVWNFAGAHAVVDRGVLAAVAGLLTLHGALVCLLRVERLRPVLLGALLLAICVEAVWFSTISLADRRVITKQELTEKIGYNDYTVDALRHVQSVDSGFYRVSKDYASAPTDHRSLNDAKVQGYFGTSSYYSFNQINYVEFLAEVGILGSERETATRWLKGLNDHPLLLTWASVKYLLVKNVSNDFLTLGQERMKTFGDVTLFENSNFLPLGFSYDRAIAASDYARLDDIGKQALLMRAVVLDDALRRGEFDALADVDLDDPPSLSTGYTLGMAMDDAERLREDVLELETFSQTALRGSIELSHTKLLFFSIPFDPGWSATVNGAPARLQRVNIGFSGLLLPPGRHEIGLEFAAPYRRASALVSVLALGCYLWLLWRGRASRAAGRTAPPG